jgi:PLP dependent protein
MQRLSGDIKANLAAVQERIARACRRSGRAVEEVTLIAVTKTVDPEDIQTAYDLGLRNFGENRVQEAEKKIEIFKLLRPHPTWHLIGHLQSNKVKQALALFDMVQSVDSPGLAEAINCRARAQDLRTPVLLQVNVSGETTKGGFSLTDIEDCFYKVRCLSNIQVKGLMTIAPLVEDPEQVRPLFRKLKELGDRFALEHLSMGMTNDFEVAVEEGASMIRVGRAIFGERSII